MLLLSEYSNIYWFTRSEADEGERIQKEKHSGPACRNGREKSLKRELGFDLTLLGIVSSERGFCINRNRRCHGGRADVSFVIAALACLFAALSYAEFASSVPVSGSVYTFTYATLGELLAFIIGWDLILEYMLAVSAVSVGWSGYFQSFLAGFGIHLPTALNAPGSIKGTVTFFNLPHLLSCLRLHSSST